jgi:hypothetical protein
MGITVSFSSPLGFGPIGPGQEATQTTSSENFSASVDNLMATITGPASNVFSVLSVTVYELEPIVDNGGDGPRGPLKPVRVETDVVAGQSNGVTPLPVASGQSVEVIVQFAPVPSSPLTCSATLQIQGSGLDTVSVPLTGSVGEVMVSVPPVTVVQNQSANVPVTVTLVAGPATTATLTLATYSTLSPEGFLTLSSPSVLLSPGPPSSERSVALTADVGDLAPGSYEFSLGVSAFDDTYNNGCTVTVTVVLPYFVIQNPLGYVIDIAGASLDVSAQNSPATENQLWNFMPDPAGSGYYYIVSKLNGNVIEIRDASTAPGALLDASPRNVAEDGFSGSDNQLWYFVDDPSDPDPSNPSLCRIVSALNGNVIDIKYASTAPGALLDAYPPKLTEAENQQWSVVGGSFPAVVPTEPYSPGWGNGKVNYLLDGNGEALTGVSVTVDFSTDFSSSANGYGFQLNCSSTQVHTVSTPTYQQFVVYANPGDNQLYAAIDTLFADTQIVLIDQVPLAALPSPTIPANYSITIALTYYQEPQYQYTDQYTAIVTGATYTVMDNTKTVIGTTEIQFLDQQIYGTGQPVTMANLAPIAALQLCIVGDYHSHAAILTEGAGTITYYTSSAFTLMEPTGIETTVENANVFYGPLPWPWSISMTEVSQQFVQLFEINPGTP